MGVIIIRDGKVESDEQGSGDQGKPKDKGRREDREWPVEETGLEIVKETPKRPLMPPNMINEIPKIREKAKKVWSN